MNPAQLPCRRELGGRQDPGECRVAVHQSLRSRVGVGGVHERDARKALPQCVHAVFGYLPGAHRLLDGDEDVHAYERRTKNERLRTRTKNQRTEHRTGRLTNQRTTLMFLRSSFGSSFVVLRSSFVGIPPIGRLAFRAGKSLQSPWLCPPPSPCRRWSAPQLRRRSALPSLHRSALTCARGTQSRNHRESR